MCCFLSMQECNVVYETVERAGKKCQTGWSSTECDVRKYKSTELLLRSIATNVADCRFLLLFLPEVEIIPQEEIMLGVKMFSRKSGFVPCLTTLQKCNLHVGPLGLRWHCDAAS